MVSQGDMVMSEVKRIYTPIREISGQVICNSDEEKTIDDLLSEWLIECDIPSGISRWDDGQWHYIDVDLYGAPTFADWLSSRGYLVVIHKMRYESIGSVDYNK